MDVTQKSRGNYLSIDGGASGLPALYIVDEMGKRLQFDLKSDEEMLPWMHFDLIIGTGTGGLVAILIGRLRLTPTKAIEAYMKLMPALSFEPAGDDKQRKTNTDTFKAAFQEVLSASGFQSDSPMLDNDGTKVALCTSNIANLLAVHLIRSYHTRSAPIPACTILEAACACVASPETFLPVVVGQGHRQVTLIDAYTACANPGKELLREAQRLFGDDAEVATMLSIGSGKEDVWVMSETNGAEQKYALKRAAISCEPVHEELYSRLRETAIYFRLNIERGSGPQMDLSSSRIEGYLRQEEISDKLEGAIRSVARRPKGVKLKEINAVTAVQIALKPRPSLIQNFIGRQDILDELRRTHISNRTTGLTAPTTTVLSGLGGSGKTQTALKLALEFESLYPNVPIYFLNASTEENLKADFETLIRSLGPEYRSSTYEDALRLLKDQVKNWLLILDNADNPRFRLFPYIPKSPQGHVIITTRNSNHALLAPDSSHHLEGLSTEDAIELILTASSYQRTEVNRIIARQIVDELGRLPLALAQAAGYIFVLRCLPSYLNIYRQSNGKVLAEGPSELPSDYPSSVETTIRLSLERLSVETRNVLQLFAYVDSTSIAHEIIVKAAERHFRRVLWSERLELNAQTVSQADALMKIFCASGEWSEVTFNKLINQCLQYSLLRLTSQGTSKFYSMHILVQSYLRATPNLIPGHRPGQLVACLLGSSITYRTDHEGLEFYRLVLPHIRLIKMEDIIEAGDHFGFSHVLRKNGYRRLSLPHMERCVELWSNSLGDDHKHTMAAMGSLAISYQSVGNIQKALEVGERVLDVEKRLLGSEDPDTLITMGNLANSYSQAGRHKEAVEMGEKLLEIRKRILGPEDPLTLFTMRNLANSYSKLGNHQESLKLKENVLEIQKKMFAPDNPQILITTSNLASSYNAVGRHQEALEMQEKVLEIQKRDLGEDHSNTLLTMCSLAVSYWKLGKHKEAMDLNGEVLEMQTKLLGKGHPDTLGTMYNQLCDFQHFRMRDKLVDLLRVALPLCETDLGMDHPLTLKTKKDFGRYLEPKQVEDVLPATPLTPPPQLTPKNESLSPTGSMKKSRLSPRLSPRLESLWKSFSGKRGNS